MKYTMIKEADGPFKTFADLKPGDLFIMPRAWVDDDKYKVFLKTKYSVSCPGFNQWGNAIVLENGGPALILEDAVVKVYSKSVEFHFSDFNG